VNIPGVSTNSAFVLPATTSIRFNPALNFNGAAPTLTAHLVEGSPSSISPNGMVVGLTDATGGTTAYSADTVVLSQSVTAVNDAPVNTVGGTLNAAEDGGAVNVTGISITDVEANPATDLVTVTLDVDHGTLAIRTDVSGGITAGQITSQDADTITIVATINQINATLAAAGGLTYTPDANYNGADRVRVTTNDGGVSGQDPGLTGTETSEQDEDDKTIAVAAVNDPVTTSAPTDATVAEDSTNQAITGLSISDTDAALAPGGIYVVTLSSTNGTMTLSTLTGLTFSTGDGTSDATMTFRGTLADINTALATATYTPTANYNGPAQIQLQATDTFGGTVATGTGAATNDSDTVAVTVTAVNDDPAIANLQGDDVGFVEGSTPQYSDAGGNAAVTDVDGGNFDGGTLTVEITANEVAAEDVLAPGTDANFTIDGNQVKYQGTTIATFTGGTSGDPLVFTFNANATPALVSTLTTLVNYDNTNEIEPSTAVRTLTWTLTDGDGGSTSRTSTMTVLGVNDEPAGTDDSAAAAEGTPYTFLLTDFTDGFSDTDGDGFAGVKITTLPSTGTLKLNGTAINAGDVITAAQLTAGDFTYEAAAGSAGTSPTFTFPVKDDGGTANGGVEFDQTPNTFTMNIAGGNAAPAIDLNGGGTGIDNAASYTEGASPTILAPDLTVTDTDSANLTGATVSIAGFTAADYLTLGGITAGTTGTGGAITFSYDASTGVLTLTGTASAADYQAALRNVAYGSTSENPGDRTISWTVTDGTAASAPAATTLDVTGENDAPVNTVPGAQTGTEDTNLVFSSGNGNQISVSDPDGDNVTVTLSVTNGRLTLAQTTGLTSVSGDGTATVVLSGSLTNVNAALNGLTYRGNLNYEGTDTLTVETSDGALSDSDQVQITLADDGIIHGDSGNNVLVGTPQGDLFHVHQGGDDNVSGLAGRDIIYFGAAFTSADVVDGGADYDSLVLQGNYSALTSLGTVTNVESISLLSGANTGFGDTANNRYDYNLTVTDGQVGAGGVLKVNGSQLLAGEDLTFNGSAETNGSFLMYGGKGVDTLTGGAQADTFVFIHDGRFAAGDKVNGGGGYDVVYLRGDYTIDFNAAGFADALTNVESIQLVSASDTTYAGGGDGEFDYAITWDDDLLPSGATITINAGKLGANESLTFDGSLETNGHFRIFGGSAADTLKGGAGNDLIYGGAGSDSMTGGAGADTYRYQSVTDSIANSTVDFISDFALGDIIDLTRIDANTQVEGNQAFTFIGSGAFTNQAGQLKVTNPFSNAWLVEADVDGDGNADFQILLNTSDNHPITASDFLL
jgi:Ca2+-binding RTX toxin-like protein